jgi:uncharacterized repeat protein (TIGR01451 family)
MTLRITRQTDREKVIIGDIIRYSVTIKNDYPYTLTNITIVENIPPSVLLLPDSFSYDHSQLTIDQASSTLTCKSIGVDEELTFHYQIIITNRPTSLLYTSSTSITYTVHEAVHTIATAPHSLLAITTASVNGTHVEEDTNLSVPQTFTLDQKTPSFMERFAKKVSIPIVYDYRASTLINKAIEGDLHEDHYMSYKIHRPSKFGEAVINEQGKWSYTPAQNYLGIDYFIIDIIDYYGNKYYFNMIISTKKTISTTQHTIAQYDNRRNIPKDLSTSHVVQTREAPTSNEHKEMSTAPKTQLAEQQLRIPVFEESSPVEEQIFSHQEQPVFEEFSPVEEQIFSHQEQPVFKESSPVEEQIFSHQKQPVFDESSPVEEQVFSHQEQPVLEESSPVEEQVFSHQEQPVLEESSPVEEQIFSHQEQPVPEESSPVEEQSTFYQESPALEDAYMGEISPTKEQFVAQTNPDPIQPLQHSAPIPLGIPNLMSLNQYNVQLVHKQSLIPISLNNHSRNATPFKLMSKKGNFATFSYLAQNGNMLQEEYLTVNLTKFSIQNRELTNHNKGSHLGDN